MLSCTVIQKTPLVFLTPTIVLNGEKGERGQTDPLPVCVGLDDAERYQFPTAFQTSYLAQTSLDQAYGWMEVPKEPLTVGGKKIKNIEIWGLTQETREGVGDEAWELDRQLRTMVEAAFNIEIPQVSGPKISPDEIRATIEANNQILVSLGLAWRHDWGRLFKFHPQSYLSFIPAYQSNFNLFRIAFNLFRFRQLIGLMEIAYRNNAPARNSALDLYITRNLDERSKRCIYSLEPDEAPAIESLDLALRLALIKEITWRRKPDQPEMSEEELLGLELFLRGSCYYATSRFFFAAADRLGEKAGVLKRLVHHMDFYYALNSIKLVLISQGLWPEQDNNCRVIAATREYLPYHGAMVIRTFEKVSSQTFDPEALMQLPVPFDLFSKIDEHYRWSKTN